MSFDLMIIDLDNTLYTADSGVFAHMDKRMTAFMVRELGVDVVDANALRLKYWKQYGTTLRGLMLHHGMEPETFLHEVHDIGVHEMLAPDAALNTALNALPGRKVIHTNGIYEHAERVLNALKVAHHFSAIYDIRFDHYQPKPNTGTLRMLLAKEGINPAQTVVIDDMEENLTAARAIGAQTALISTCTPSKNWDFHAASLPELSRTIGSIAHNAVLDHEIR